MRGLLLFARGIDALNGFIGRAMGWVAVAMVAIGVINVVGRYLGASLGMQLSSNALLEAQTYAYSMIFLLAAAYVLRRNGHIRVDVIYGGRTQRTQAWIDVFGTLFLLIPFCIFALYFSVDYVARSWRILESSPNPGGLPRYPIKAVILAGFSMLLAQGVSELIKRIAWLRGIPGVPGPGDDDMRRKLAEGEA
ncbi:TRAP transporter small permease subunit [Aquisalimonas asiatica]|uniref:TRAP transporter small permease protein n=1 Tax=Aquisalimonas asiatica TaxID=406100 RepID=A0A1H8PS27_9GAMM|nr:TRAP transporter small permease subunit [Aquisalimonas asiatica]SEO44353.1 TRAP-type mannitol/chloroaromatic compound transport system, small permease component [Aquisalimonas asiatica]